MAASNAPEIVGITLVGFPPNYFAFLISGPCLVAADAAGSLFSGAALLQLAG
ncbi:hypothetical protein GGQ97_002629 [Sphingomonas kaistensis]|uniref:Uncharacterized protein n=1 Tax=Sphingomonas kaistensis TaxID=298708 RepID=A0A7X5YB08_9SPHN|nr:hypothetical protein [Sphingomonas kaistensis]NJC06836.1 hypothetical protein [Sphingomonas kaistensis]